MTDYKAAFVSGLEEARKAERARKEIDAALSDFASQLEALSSGKIRISLRTYEIGDSSLFAIIEFPPKPRETYTAITAVNPTVKSPILQLAKWKPGAAGYPCMLGWSGQEKYCEDKEALQRCLGELIADPLTGEKLLSLMVLQDQPKKSDEAEQGS